MPTHDAHHLFGAIIFNPSLQQVTQRIFNGMVMQSHRQCLEHMGILTTQFCKTLINP